MKDLSIGDMRRMQDELQKKYGADWIQLTPENGHYSVLWAVSEIGEVVDVIKKQGDQAIMEDPETREHFISEVADVTMFLMDLLTCYHISTEEFADG